MSYLLFIFYVVLFSWLLGKIPFVQRAVIPRHYLIGFFLLKVAAGLVYGYVHANAPGHVGLTDTWKFFYQGSEETAQILADPFKIIRDILPRKVHHGLGGVFSTDNSYWNDIKHELMVKFAAVLNIFSGSNYYVNVVWYNFITMAGPVALYRVLKPWIGNDGLRYLLAFCIPSTLFWCSGFHKEGLLLSAIALLIYVAQRLQTGPKLGWTHYLAALISLMTMLLLRSNLLLPLAPALLGFLVLLKWTARPWLVYGLVLLLGMAGFFLSPWLGVDLPAEVSNRQQEFMALGGRTALAVTPLEPSFSSFLAHLPSALTIGFLKPFPGEGGMMYLPFTAELWVLLSVFIYIIYKRRRPGSLPAVLPLMLVFGLLNWLMIGYTVPNIGAVIRYRSVTTPLLFSALAIWLALVQPVLNTRKI